VRASLRRSAAASGVTNVELFFDLVYAFAVTQLSHFLLDRAPLPAFGRQIARAGLDLHALSLLGAVAPALLMGILAAAIVLAVVLSDRHVASHPAG
jgi:hypothetical protein